MKPGWQRKHSQRNMISALKINIPALPFWIWEKKKKFSLYLSINLTAGDHYPAQMFYFTFIIYKR